jgi:YidC/Oxa1 family membrane protein insertase
LLGPLAGANAMALAVVLFTIAVRLAVSPLSVAQARGERRRAALAPRLQEIRQRYGDQPDRLREELAALGGAPLAGCLPALLQAPFFFLMYRVFTVSPPAGALFGIPLGAHIGAALPVFAGLIAVLLLLGWFFARRARQAAASVEGPLGRLLPVLPFLSVLAAFVLPLAAMLYLVTSTAWTALEHAVLRRPLPAGGAAG